MKELLVVDDDEITIMLLNFQLSHAFPGDLVTTKNNGEDAFEYLVNKMLNRETFPEIVFLDLHMPVLNGFGFLKKYQHFFAEQYPATRLIILSNSISEHDQNRVMEYPFVGGFYDKPLNERTIQTIKSELKVL